MPSPILISGVSSYHSRSLGPSQVREALVPSIGMVVDSD